VLSLALLVAGVVGLGMGIRHGAIRPPDGDVSLGGFHIVTYTTDRPQCEPYLLCAGAPREYQVI